MTQCGDIGDIAHVRHTQRMRKQHQRKNRTWVINPRMSLRVSDRTRKAFQQVMDLCRIAQVPISASQIINWAVQRFCLDLLNNFYSLPKSAQRDSELVYGCFGSEPLPESSPQSGSAEKPSASTGQQ